MGVMIGGRELGVQSNGIFDTRNTDPIPGGKLWTEAALTWNAMRAAYIASGGSPANFMPAGPRSSARTLDAQQFFWTHQPPPAAFPGTSNHGWGIAVDVLTRAAAAWIMRNGHRFGWSWDEGKRVGEWWHMRYVGASPSLLRKLTRDPLAGFTTSEKRWVREYDRLLREHRDLKRRRVLRRVMKDQRSLIWRLAQPVSVGGDGKGWTKARKRRYEALKRRSS